LQDWTLTDDFAGVDIAGLDNEGLDTDGLDNDGRMCGAYTAADAAADTTCEVCFMAPHPQHIEVISIFISPYMAAQ